MAIASKVFFPVAVLIVALLAGAGPVAAQPDQEGPGIFPPMPPEPLRVVNLVVGCNNVALTYPDGTPVGVVVGSINPQGAMYAIWRLNPSPPPPATGPTYEGFAPAAPQVSDLQGVNFLEAVFLCVSVPATITMPAVQPWPYPIPLPQSTPGPGSQ
jgi:hypothetical protein